MLHFPLCEVTAELKKEGDQHINKSDGGTMPADRIEVAYMLTAPGLLPPPCREAPYSPLSI